MELVKTGRAAAAVTDFGTCSPPPRSVVHTEVLVFRPVAKTDRGEGLGEVQSILAKPTVYTALRWLLIAGPIRLSAGPSTIVQYRFSIRDLHRPELPFGFLRKFFIIGSYRTFLAVSTITQGRKKQTFCAENRCIPRQGSPQ